MSNVDMDDVETDADDIEEEDDREDREYIIEAAQTIIVRFRVSARDDDEARQEGQDVLHGMRFKTYIHNYDGRSGAEMIGLEENGRPCNDVSFDIPERPDSDEMTVEEA